MKAGLCSCICVSVRERISKTAGPIFTNFFVHDRKGRGLVVLRRCNDISCTSGFMDDFTFLPRELCSAQ